MVVRRARWVGLAGVVASCLLWGGCTSGDVPLDASGSSPAAGSASADASPTGAGAAEGSTASSGVVAASLPDSWDAFEVPDAPISTAPAAGPPSAAVSGPLASRPLAAETADVSDSAPVASDPVASDPADASSPASLDTMTSVLVAAAEVASDRPTSAPSTSADSAAIAPSDPNASAASDGLADASDAAEGADGGAAKQDASTERGPLEFAAAGTDLREKLGVDWHQISDRQWRSVLTREQFSVTRRKATERPYTGELWDNKRNGTYACLCCGLALFSSATKYESGTGWPSFWQPLSEENIGTEADYSFFVRRTEVHCSRCGAHLGHVFQDGPPPTGLRYCMNSAALKFIAASESDEDAPQRGRSRRRSE